MIIILEGPSKCGKTTLADYICTKYGFGYIKCSQPKGDPYEEYMGILKKIERRGGHWVLDRFNLGELVWGPLYRQQSGLSDEKFRNIELKALAFNPMLIYCFDTVKNISTRFKEDNEEWEEADKIKQSLDLYKEALKKSIIFQVHHQMKTVDDILRSKKIDRLIDWMADNEDNCYYKTIIGNTFNPRYIFIGDKRNERQKYLKYAQPFDFGPASKFLFEKLAEARIRLDRVAIMNSDSPELKRFIMQKWNIMELPAVVTLGKNADKRLNKLNIEHYVLPHPQYVNRFFHKDNDFANQLKKIK